MISRLLVGAESGVQSVHDDGVPPIWPLAVAAKARMAAKVFMIEMGEFVGLRWPCVVVAEDFEMQL